MWNFLGLIVDGEDLGRFGEMMKGGILEGLK
jgi:hypothetical protein